MRVGISDYDNNGTSLTVDWIRMSPPFASPCTFTSRVFDAGGIVNWDTISWTGNTPSGTNLTLSYRTGNTPIPEDGPWTLFTTVSSSGAALSGSSRYIQYQANLSASDTEPDTSAGRCNHNAYTCRTGSNSANTYGIIAG